MTHDDKDLDATRASLSDFTLRAVERAVAAAPPLNEEQLAVCRVIFAMSPEELTSRREENDLAIKERDRSQFKRDRS